MATKPKTKKEQELETMRETVIEQELSARSWKSYYEKMYFTIECSKIEDEYNVLAKKNADRFREQQAKMQEMLGELNSGIQTDNGELTVKPVAEA